MSKNIENSLKEKEISRKEAIKKIGTYGKYAALAGLATYLVLSPKEAQASSPLPPPGDEF